MKNKATQSKAWATVQIARHPERPQFLDYVSEIFTEFDALHGDRLFGDDGAMIGGLARFDGQPVMVVGQHRGRGTREKLQHNFGMCNPEGYRKSQRLLDLAERFNLPVFTFIDTMGAYPGVGAEGAEQRQELADEAGRAGQADIGHGEEHEHRRIGRHPVHQPAISVDIAGMHAVIDHADTEKQRPRDETMRQHLEDGAVDADLVGREGPHGHIAHMRDRGIGDDLLHVGLRQRHQRGIDDGDGRQPEDDVL